MPLGQEVLHQVALLSESSLVAFPGLLHILQERCPVLNPTQAVSSHQIPGGVVYLHTFDLASGRQNHRGQLSQLSCLCIQFLRSPLVRVPPTSGKLVTWTADVCMEA